LLEHEKTLLKFSVQNLDNALSSDLFLFFGLLFRLLFYVFRPFLEQACFRGLGSWLVMLFLVELLYRFFVIGLDLSDLVLESDHKRYQSSSFLVMH
jgi:hypothetical protein